MLILTELRKVSNILNQQWFQHANLSNIVHIVQFFRSRAVNNDVNYHFDND